MNPLRKIVREELAKMASDNEIEDAIVARVRAEIHALLLQKPASTPKEVLMSFMGDVALAAAAGIPVDILQAIRQLESGGRTNAVRFEPHVFHRETDGRYRTQVPFTPDPTRGVSLVSSETNRAAFERARRLDERAAIRSTSWGLYQVMGGALLRLFPQDPVGHFDRDPAGVSDQLLVEWFRTRPAAVTAANARDISRLAELYNGSQRWGERLAAILARNGASCPWILIGDSQAVGLKTPLASRMAGKGFQLVEVFANVGWGTRQTLMDLGPSIRTAVRERQPKLVLVVLGGNDTAGDSLRVAITDLVELLRSNGAQNVVWVGPAHAVPPDIAERKRRVAEMQEPLVTASGGIWLDGREMTRDLQHAPDGVHFVRSSQERWAADLATRLVPSPSLLWALTPFGALFGDEFDRC